MTSKEFLNLSWEQKLNIYCELNHISLTPYQKAAFDIIYSQLNGGGKTFLIKFLCSFEEFCSPPEYRYSEWKNRFLVNSGKNTFWDVVEETKK